MGIRVPPRIRVLPSGTLSQTLNFKNIAATLTASQSCCQQNLSTVELVDRTYDGRLVVDGRTYFITRRSTEMLLSPLLPRDAKHPRY